MKVMERKIMFFVYMKNKNIMLTFFEKYKNC